MPTTTGGVIEGIYPDDVMRELERSASTHMVDLTRRDGDNRDDDGPWLMLLNATVRLEYCGVTLDSGIFLVDDGGGINTLEKKGKRTGGAGKTSLRINCTPVKVTCGPDAGRTVTVGEVAAWSIEDDEARNRVLGCMYMHVPGDGDGGHAAEAVKTMREDASRRHSPALLRPIDRVSKAAWGELDGLELGTRTGVRVSAADARDEVATYLTLDYQQEDIDAVTLVGGASGSTLDEAVTLSDKGREVMTASYRMIADACSSLYVAGHTLVTPYQILESLGYSHPSKSMADRCVEMVRSLTRLHASIDYTDEMMASAKGSGDYVITDMPVVPAVEATWWLHGKRVDGFRLLGPSPYLIHAFHARRQLVTVPCEVLEAGTDQASTSLTGASIRAVLFERLKLMSEGRLNSDVISYDYLAAHAGMKHPTRKQRARLISTVKDALDDYASRGVLVETWSETVADDSTHKRTGVRVRVVPDEAVTRHRGGKRPSTGGGGR